MIFGGNEQRLDFEQIAVREGLFHALAVIHNVKGKIDDFRVTYGLNNAIKSLLNNREVLQRWLMPLRQSEHLPISNFEIEREPEKEHLDDKKQKQRHREKKGHVVLDRVQREKKAIVQAMQRGDLKRAHNLI